MSHTATSILRVFEDPPALRRKFENLLAKADIRIDGGRPWDIQLKAAAPGWSRRFAAWSLRTNVRLWLKTVSLLSHKSLKVCK